jgi:hypothetical protein
LDDTSIDSIIISDNNGGWRLLQYDINYSNPAIECLHVQLPFENNVVFIEDDDLEEVIENLNNV